MKRQGGLLLAWVVGCSAVGAGAEPILTLGDNESALQVLLMRPAKIESLTQAQQSAAGLVALAREQESVVAYYDDARGGVVGFLGAQRIVYAGAALAGQWRRGVTRPLMQLFEDHPPVSLQERRRLGPGSRRPVQLTPYILAVPLKDRPADFVAVESARGVKLLEIVSVSPDAASIHVRVLAQESP